MRFRIVSAILTCMLMLGSLLLSSNAVKAADADYDIPNGHFYTQAAGPTAAPGTGYSITDEGTDDRGQTIKFWSEFKRLGGVQALGYPASRCFKWNGFVVQVTQRVVLQWRSDVNGVYFLNVMDLITDAGKDDYLESVRQTPKPANYKAEEQGLSFQQIVEKRYKLLDANPAIKAKFFSIADPLNMNGLPTAPITDKGDVYVLRAQRIIIQQWKKDVPWAKAGEVTVALGGDISKEVGLVAAQDPQAVIPLLAGGVVPPPPAGGPKLELQEVLRQPNNNGALVGYKVVTSGFPQGKAYSLIIKVTGHPDSVFMGEGAFSVDAQGTLTFSGVPIGQLTIAGQYTKGQTLEVVVESTDKAVSVSAKVVPVP